MTRKFFFDAVGDQRMERQNQVNWQALANLVENEASASLPSKPWDILDIGCHTGGLLELFEKKFSRRLNGQSMVTSLVGVEPLFNARKVAEHRFPKGEFFQKISQVPNQSADLVVSHEMLYLVPNLADWVRELKRILRPDGGAFIALGSHDENTAWLRWRKPLQKKYGHASYAHQPMDILAAGEKAGFDMELHRLNPVPQTGIRYSPPEDGWGEFISAEETFKFQQWKYVFVFYPKR